MSGGGTNNRSTRLLIGALSLLVSAVCVEMTLCVLGRIWLPVMLKPSFVMMLPRRAVFMSLVSNFGRRLSIFAR